MIEDMLATLPDDAQYATKMMTALACTAAALLGAADVEEAGVHVFRAMDALCSDSYQTAVSTALRALGDEPHLYPELLVTTYEEYRRAAVGADPLTDEATRWMASAMALTCRLCGREALERGLDVVRAPEYQAIILATLPPNMAHGEKVARMVGEAYLRTGRR